MTMILTFAAGLLVGAVAGALARGRISARFFARARKDDRLMALGARLSARQTMAEQAEFLGHADLAQRMRGLAAEDQRRIGEAMLEPSPVAAEEDD